MNQLIHDTISTVGIAVICIVSGIVALTIFYRILGWIDRRSGRPPQDPLNTQGLLNKETSSVSLPDGSRSATRRVAFHPVKRALRGHRKEQPALGLRAGRRPGHILLCAHFRSAGTLVW